MGEGAGEWIWRNSYQNEFDGETQGDDSRDKVKHITKGAISYCL